MGDTRRAKAGRLRLYDGAFFHGLASIGGEDLLDVLRGLDFAGRDMGNASTTARAALSDGPTVAGSWSALCNLHFVRSYDFAAHACGGGVDFGAQRVGWSRRCSVLALDSGAGFHVRAARCRAVFRTS